MEQISFYLKKFENLGLKESNLKKIVIDSIQEITKVEIEEDDLELIRDQIKIKKTGPIKSEIFIYKKQIEKKIEDRLNSEGREIKFRKKIR